MQISIRSRNFSLTDALRNHASKRLRFALSRCSDHIRRVVMQLSDINGPRGGIDKRCQLRLVLDGMPDVIINDVEADMYTAIDRAADRAGRTLARKLGRLHRLGKQSGMLKTGMANVTLGQPV